MAGINLASPNQCISVGLSDAGFAVVFIGSFEDEDVGHTTTARKYGLIFDSHGVQNTDELRNIWFSVPRTIFYDTLECAYNKSGNTFCMICCDDTTLRFDDIVARGVQKIGYTRQVPRGPTAGKNIITITLSAHTFCEALEDLRGCRIYDPTVVMTLMGSCDMLSLDSSVRQQTGGRKRVILFETVDGEQPLDAHKIEYPIMLLCIDAFFTLLDRGEGAEILREMKLYITIKFGSRQTVFTKCCPLEGKQTLILRHIK